MTGSYVKILTQRVSKRKSKTIYQEHNSSHVSPPMITCTVSLMSNVPINSLFQMFFEYYLFERSYTNQQHGRVEDY